MKRKIIFVAGSVAASFVLAAAALAVVERHSGTGPHGTVSNNGQAIDPASIAPGERRALDATGATGAARFLGARGSTAFYRVAGAGSKSCFAFGRSGAGATFTAIACPSDFPNADNPILDQSGLQVDLATGQVHVTMLRGVASDAVTRVGVVDAAGQLHATPVRNNLYLLEHVPAGADKAIVAFDASGAQIFTHALDGFAR